MADARKEGAYSLHPEPCHAVLGCGAVAVADIYRSVAAYCTRQCRHFISLSQCPLEDGVIDYVQSQVGN